MIVFDVHNLEFEGKVPVTWDIFDPEILQLLECILSNHFVGPKIPDLDILVFFWEDTQVLNFEFI